MDLMVTVKKYNLKSITALVKDPLRFSNKNVNIKIGFNQMSLKEKEVSQTRE